MNRRKSLYWGPYLSERQWGTVREDYSGDGNAWRFFPFEHSHIRQYRWGEDGIAGFTNVEGNLCMSPAFWNGNDPILKERLFGLAGPEGNHGEDCKELYYYLESLPDHSYCEYLYKYPIRAFPYATLKSTNASRGKKEGEFELTDTHIFESDNYFDIYIRYLKLGEKDIVMQVEMVNRSLEAAKIHCIPQVWFRNEWQARKMLERPNIQRDSRDPNKALITHPELENYYFFSKTGGKLLLTNNGSNRARLYREVQKTSAKDAIESAVFEQSNAAAEALMGTKLGVHYSFNIAPGKSSTIEVRLSVKDQITPFDRMTSKFTQARKRTETYYSKRIPSNIAPDLKQVYRQASASLLWSKQFYYFDIQKWLDGDKNAPQPPASRRIGRNSRWGSLKNKDIISMPDKWEYPWYAAWDLAFHCLPFARLDPQFAKDQMLLMLDERYMHPNGQIPAYEWSFSDVNPPVHAWGCIEVAKIDAQENGKWDISFLKRVFHKLLLNFNWWVNQKDRNGNNIFEGGFLGLDNIGAFDRSNSIPGGGILEQADGTAWMGMYCLNMLEIAIEISLADKTYQDIAFKFLHHFYQIAESLNQIGANHPGVWNEEEGFFFDVLRLPNGREIPIKVRSLVGLVSLFGVLNISKAKLAKLPQFNQQIKQFRDSEQASANSRKLLLENSDSFLLCLLPKSRLKRIMTALLDEEEFLSPFGIRSMSKIHEIPYVLQIEDHRYALQYEPGESQNNMFGGNSNWRGPVWMPMNYLIIQSLERFYEFYGDNFKSPFPTNDGQQMTLHEISVQLVGRLLSLFRKDGDGHRPIHNQNPLYLRENFEELILFYEYFHGDNGKGLGASHQTGWTALVMEFIHRYFPYLTAT